MKNTWSKTLTTGIAAGALSLLAVSAVHALPASACTAVYVGQDASEDGTTIVARSNDYPDVWPNYLTVVDRVENQPGRTMPVDNNNTVQAEIPATTYKYTATPWMDSATTYNKLESDAAACANEYGVSMTMSISAFANDAALEADPLVENGLTEFTADDLVICQSKTAREAVDTLLGLVDKYGSSECNIALISDQTETWYVEMYTGHQYAAVKLPADQVAVFGNEYNLEYVSDYEDSILSEDLEKTAVKNGFAAYGENKELNLMKTYAIDPINYSHMRTWIGHQVLAPSVYGADYEQDAVYPLTFQADSKVSLKDVMELMRNRFDGTSYSPDETGRKDMRVIGTDTALSVHIFQTYPDLPADMSCVTWESASPTLYGVFVPVSNMSTRVSEAYALNQPASDLGLFDTETYPWYTFRDLNTLCVSDKKTYGDSVRAYWSKAEDSMITGMDKVLRTAAASDKSEAKKAEYITSYCVSMQDNAFKDAKAILNQVRWTMSKNCNTMKVGRNPETHDTTDEEKLPDPIVLTIEGSDYTNVPKF